MMFSLNDTSMINYELINDLIFDWVIDDPILQEWFDTNYEDTINFTIPISQFKIDNTYSIEVSITNPQQTFYDIITIDFIPQECYVFYINDLEAVSIGNDLN